MLKLDYNVIETKSTPEQQQTESQGQLTQLTPPYHANTRTASIRGRRGARQHHGEHDDGGDGLRHLRVQHCRANQQAQALRHLRMAHAHREAARVRNRVRARVARTPGCGTRRGSGRSPLHLSAGPSCAPPAHAHLHPAEPAHQACGHKQAGTADLTCFLVQCSSAHPAQCFQVGATPTCP